MVATDFRNDFHSYLHLKEHHEVAKLCQELFPQFVNWFYASRNKHQLKRFVMSKCKRPSIYKNKV